MKELLIFHLLLSAGHLIPLTLLTAALVCDMPLPFLPNTRDDRLPTSRRARLDRMRALAVKDFLKEWVPVALFLQMTAVAIISIAINYDVKLSFVPNVELPQGVIFGLLSFAVTTSSILLTPILFLALVGVKLWRITPANTISSSNNSAEIIYYDEEADTHTTIRLFRFRTFEKTIIYANCQDDDTEEVTSFIFVRRHEADALTECYCNNNGNLERVTPTPATISELESVFNSSNN